VDRWWQHRFRVMGSPAHLMGLGGPPDAPARAAAEVARLESCWSRFQADSELQVLNGDPRLSVEVSDDLALAVDRALTAWRLTDGRFDPTVHDALVAAGYDRDFRDLRDLTLDPPTGVPVPGCADVHVDLDTGRVTRPPGVALDLGGIGKGLAADLVTDRLLGHGVRSVCVSLGGDVRVGGDTPAGGWHIPVEDPFDEDARMLTVVLDDGAIVTSATRFRRWQTSDGGWAHHLIDPATGRPAGAGVAAVVAIAAEAWWAEALAKAALVAGPEDGTELLRRHGAEGWIVRDDAEVLSCAR
jgi:thiamine biosynthesis lipoprotein